MSTEYKKLVVKASNYRIPMPKNLQTKNQPKPKEENLNNKYYILGDCPYYLILIDFKDLPQNREENPHYGKYPGTKSVCSIPNP